MTNKQIKAEFARWIDADRPSIWIKFEDIESKWELKDKVSWDSNQLYYIVGDNHSELRKLQIDEPNTKFQVKSKIDGEWKDISIIFWDLVSKYRVKPKEWYEDPNMIDKYIWVRNYTTEEWLIYRYTGYIKDARFPYKTFGKCWKYAIPVKYDNL